MAEQTQTTELNTGNKLNNGGMLSRANNALESFSKFTNEPAVQRSIPVMITLFVIFIGIVLPISPAI